MTAIDYQQRSVQKSIQTILGKQIPRLSDTDLKKFVLSFFSRRDELLAPLATHQSPLYIFEPRVLADRSRQFQHAFTTHFDNCGFYYAVKSNNYPHISKTLLQTGFGLDVSSGVELKMVCDLGAEDIIFSGPGKTRLELEMAVGAAEKVTVLIDSFHELAVLGQISSTHKKHIRVGVRLNTNPEGLWRKFGILPQELSNFICKAKDFPFINFMGIQFHTSWNLNAQAQLDFIITLGNILAQLPLTTRNQISFIDIGGGYWPEQGEWLQHSGTETAMLRKILFSGPEQHENHYCQCAQPIELFAKQLGEAIKTDIRPLIPSCRICFEPGRWLCHNAMHLMMTVVDKKSDDLVITDAGTNAIGWERFETDYFPVLNLSRPAMSEKQCNILGSLCTPHDIWGYNYWGEDIQIGDILLIPTQGAYTYSLKQNFIKPLPEVAAI